MGAHRVLIVVDVQNGFMPGGGLPVPPGHEVVPIINQLAKKSAKVVRTQDGKKPFDTIQMPYGTQVLWPDHCVQRRHDAALHKDLHIPHAQLIVRKGFHAGVDSYSAFVEADRKTSTGLTAYRRARGRTPCTE